MPKSTFDSYILEFQINTLITSDHHKFELDFREIIATVSRDHKDNVHPVCSLCIIMQYCPIFVSGCSSP